MLLLSIASIFITLNNDSIFFIVFLLSFKVSNFIPSLIIMKMNPLLYIQPSKSIHYQVPL